MKKFKLSLVLIIGIAIATVILVFSTFIIIQPTERGIVFKKFTTGLDKEHVREPGFHIIAPWNEIYTYDVRIQQKEETLDILDKNGLSLSMDVSIQFRPRYEEIGYLHEKFPQTYIRDLIIPQLRSTVRQVTGQYSAEQIYSTERKTVEDKIIQNTQKVLNKNHIHMEALLIRSIKLPPKIKESIELKLKEEQEALTYKYKLDKERQEAERKEIAAEAEAKYNRIVTESLSDNLLQWRGIEATLELSKSENSKVVVIGNNENGLPLILGND